MLARDITKMRYTDVWHMGKETVQYTKLSMACVIVLGDQLWDVGTFKPEPNTALECQRLPSSSIY